jgi:signal peptidase II
MKTVVPVSRYWCFGLLTIGGLSADLISKWWAFRALGGPHRTSDWNYGVDFLWGRFECTLTTTFNFGALFGMGQGLSWLFALLSVAAAGGIVYWLFARGHARSLWLTITLALILSGALGNLYDRINLHGWTDDQGHPIYAVRDFINCTIPGIELHGFQPRLIQEYHWPVFNLADVCLVTGAIMLMLHSFFAPRAAAEGTTAENATSPTPATASSRAA